MDEQEEIILASSDEAAQIKTLTGWVDRYGHFWGEDERMARYSGGTHKACEDCGTVYRKNAWCEPCHEKKKAAQFAAMPRQEWDGVVPLVSFDTDHYFWDADQLDIYCEDEGVTPESLRLVICEPRYMSQFEILDHCQDILPEDGDESFIPDEILEAAEKLNAAIKAATQPVSWTQGKIAAIVSIAEPVQAGKSSEASAPANASG